MSMCFWGTLKAIHIRVQNDPQGSEKTDNEYESGNEEDIEEENIFGAEDGGDEGNGEDY